MASTAALAAGFASPALAQLRLACWNISNYGGGRVSDIQTVVYGTSPIQNLRFAPDLIAVQEMTSPGALTTFVSALNTAPGSPGDWVACPWPAPSPGQGTLPDTQSLVVYRSSKVAFVQLITIATGSSATTDQPRNTFRFDFHPVGYSAASTGVAIYSVHLKAGSTSEDIARRLVETTHIRENAQGDNNTTEGLLAPNGIGLPAGWNFIMAGDTNTQTATQTAYVELVGSQADNTGRFWDPIHSGNNSSGSATNGSWNNNANYRYIHTQDPSGSGGMDDRHDQLLLSASLIDGAGLDYIGNANLQFSQTTWDDPNHSYRAWGNDGNSLNLSLNTSGNTMVGDTIAQAIKNAETTAGGHIPVYADFRVPAKVAANSLNINFGTVNQNSTAQQTLTVTNNGNVALWTVNGIQNLSYTLSASSGFTAPGGTFTDTAAAGGNNHTISMSTSTLGLKSGTITIASNDPDQPSLVVNLSGTVVTANQPPVANAGPDQTRTDIDKNGSELITLDGSASTDPQGVATIAEYRWTEGATVLAAGASATANVTLPVGSHTINLKVTDTGNLFSNDSVLITVNPGCVADVDDGNGSGVPDGGVGIEDLLYYLVLYNAGTSGADVDDGTGTGTPDGGVGIEDLLYYLVRYNSGC